MGNMVRKELLGNEEEGKGIPFLGSQKKREPKKGTRNLVVMVCLFDGQSFSLTLFYPITLNLFDQKILAKPRT